MELWIPITNVGAFMQNIRSAVIFRERTSRAEVVGILLVVAAILMLVLGR